MRARRISSEVLKEKVEEELQSLLQSWEDFFAAAEDLEEKKSVAEIFDEFIEGIETSLGKSMPGDVKSYVWSGGGEVEGNPALLFFFKDNEISLMACHAVVENLTESYNEAVTFAEANQNDRIVEYEFLKEEFRIYAKTDRKGQYITVPDKSVSAISAQASFKLARRRE